MSKLRRISYPSIGEDIYYSKLKNDFQVYLINKPGYSEKSAMLTVDYGSVDSLFTVRCKDYSNPKGLAHFLEHKVFEDNEGKDVSLAFTKLGADVNAFTTFEKTAYYFSASDNFKEALKLLQEFVVSAHFTAESIDKEKKIIAQEIDMYLDDPDYQSYIGILQNLFPNSDLANDIAGTKSSITEISLEILRRNYNQFYHASNMTLIVMGDINIEETFQDILASQEILKRRRPPQAKIAQLPYNPIVKTNSIDMDVITPKLVVGYRGKKLNQNFPILEYKIGLKLFLAMLFGWTSKNYQDWYNDGKIDDSFDIEIEIQHDFSFVLISLETNAPIAMSSKIRKKMERFPKSKDLNENHLVLLKKEIYGDFIQSLDSVDQLIHQFHLFLNDDVNYFDIPDILNRLSLEDILSIGFDFFNTAEVSDFTVFPK